MKTTFGKRLVSLESRPRRQDLRHARSLDFAALSDAEVDRLAWIAEQRLLYGDGWIEETLTPAERVELDRLLTRIVVQDP